MSFLAFIIAVTGLSNAICLYAIGQRLGAIADAIRSNGGR